MPVIFISYRREDSAGHAGRLFDQLRGHFGKDRVFLDVVGIEAGVDFVETIDKAVGSCDVLLAVIGREWLSCCDKQGRRRLDDENDFIRTEISAALQRNVRVVPVLVEGAEMPPTDALPEELKRLTRRQAVELRDSRWEADVDALIAVLEQMDAARAGKNLLPPGAPPLVRGKPAGVETGRRPGRPALLWGIGVLVAALLTVGVIRFFPRSQVGPEPKPDVPSQEAGQSQEPEPVRRTVSAPDLVGLSLDKAREKLRKSGLAVGQQEAKQTAEAPAQRVLRQWPPPGKKLDPGTPVDLVYAKPVPNRRIEAPVTDGAPAGSGEKSEPAPAGSPLQPGGSISRPEVITSVPPEYTRSARKARVTGVVIVEVIIDKEGNVEGPRVLKGLPEGLDQAAVEAVRQWKFKPAMQDGKPVKVYFTLTVSFQLK